MSVLPRTAENGNIEEEDFDNKIVNKTFGRLIGEVDLKVPIQQFFKQMRINFTANFRLAKVIEGVV